jgi:hypothetical protein
VSRAVVRDGIARFFGGPYDSQALVYRPGPLLPYGLATVRAYLPKRAADTDYTAGLPAGRAMGAYAVVHLGDTVERRVAIGGATSGWKHRAYQVTLHVYHLAMTALAEDAQADLDLLLEQITALVHGDRTLGGAVLQAGESPAGIRTTLRQPAYDQGSEHIRTYASVGFDADVYLEA